MANEKKSYLITPVFRICWPTLETPKAAEGSDKEKYSLVMLFDADAMATPEFAAIKAEVMRAAKQEFGRLFTEGVGWPTTLRFPFRNGTEAAAEKGEHFKGTLFATASSDYKPTVKNRDNVSIQNIDVYGGCYCRAMIHVYAYDNKGNKGVAIGLDGVQFVRDGEPLGRPDPVFPDNLPGAPAGAPAGDFPAASGSAAKPSDPFAMI